MNQILLLTILVFLPLVGAALLLSLQGRERLARIIAVILALTETVLACSTLTPALTAREKMVRVLVGWTDRNGKCHSRASSSLAFNW